MYPCVATNSYPSDGRQMRQSCTLHIPSSLLISFGHELIFSCFFFLSHPVNIPQASVERNLLHVALKTVANLMKIFIFVAGAACGWTQTKTALQARLERELELLFGAGRQVARQAERLVKSESQIALLLKMPAII